MKGKSSSCALRRTCSVGFDVEDESCEGNAASCPAEVYMCCEAVEDPADQQRESKRSQVDRKTQTSFVGTDSVHAEQERSRRDVAENTPANKTDVSREVHVTENETETEADVLESTQDISGGSEVDVVEEKEEPQTTKETAPKPDDLSERPGSVMSPTEPAVAAMGGQRSEMLMKDSACELDHRDDGDVEIREGKAEEQIEMINEVFETTKEKTEEDNPEKAGSREPDESSSMLRKRPERFISKKRHDRVQKQEGRSHRYLKVLQASIVTQLKW